MQLCKQLGIPTRRISGENRIGTKILKSESLAWNLTLRKTRRTTHLLLGDAGKLSFNFLSALDFLILLRKTQVAKF
jgi:hypothetical protein